MDSRVKEVSFRANVACNYLQKGTTALLQLVGLPAVMVSVGSEEFAVYGLVLAYIGLVGLATAFVGPVVIARLVNQRSLETVATGFIVVFGWALSLSVLLFFLVKSGSFAALYGVDGLQAQRALLELGGIVGVCSVVIALGELLYRILLSVKKGYIVNLLLGLKNVFVFVFLLHAAKVGDLSVGRFVAANYALEAGAYLLTVVVFLPRFVGRVPSPVRCLRGVWGLLVESKSFVSLNILNYGSREVLKFCVGRFFDQKALGVVTLALGYSANLRGLFLGFYLPLIPYKYKKSNLNDVRPILNFVGAASGLFVVSLVFFSISIIRETVFAIPIVSDVTSGALVFTVLWFLAATLRVIYFYDLKLRGGELCQLVFVLSELMGMILCVVFAYFMSGFYTFLFAVMSVVGCVLFVVFKSNCEKKSIHTACHAGG